jgi:hypothetical protein
MARSPQLDGLRRAPFCCFSRRFLAISVRVDGGYCERSFGVALKGIIVDRTIGKKKKKERKEKDS